MKKIMIGVGVVVVIALGIGGYIYYRHITTPLVVVVPEPVATTTPVVVPPVVVHDPKDATYTIEGVPVTLVKGTAETPAAPGSASMIETNYFGNEVSSDFNGDGRMDTAFLLSQSTGGTGVFYYLLAAIDQPDGIHGSEGIFIGDRIAPQSTTITDGVIAVNYADRKADEPYSALPTVGKTRYFTFDAATMKFATASAPTLKTASTTATKLTAKKWHWVRTNYADGRIFVPKKTASFSLTFASDHTVSGTTDCNTLAGPYTYGTSSLTFGRMAITMKYCDGSEEGVFDDLLGQVANYSLTKTGELHLGLKKSTGTMIFD